MYTSPRRAPSSSSVSSTRARLRGTPSQARSRPTARSSLGRRLPRRRDATTGLRIVDAVVVHATDDPHEFLLHLVALPQRHGRFVELPSIQLGAHNVVDHLFDSLRGQVL